MARYALRYLFDPGSGICLWAASPAAHERFGYPIDPRQLPLPRETRERINQLVDWYDTSVDWEYPAGPSLWDDGEQERFTRAARQLLDVIRIQLGADFDIRDELAATLPT
jgi:hypothetical protein